VAQALTTYAKIRGEKRALAAVAQAHFKAGGNGRSQANVTVNSHAHANGNGHSHANGNGNGHKHPNGGGRVISDGKGGGTGTLAPSSGLLMKNP
ncbi:MAG TPA: hypothetical protein VFA21_06025, partial [Pyrinomonadaceae bacterium]|nr:hypothetical protein [Pyrinomonadaceae bacterium]